MLRFKGIADEDEESCRFRIFDGEEPASAESLESRTQMGDLHVFPRFESRR